MPEKTFHSDGFQGLNCENITYIRNINESFDFENLLAHVDCCPYKLIQMNIGTLVRTVHNGQDEIDESQEFQVLKHQLTMEIFPQQI